MRPEIICHIMSSVDGRLLPSRWTPPFDGSSPSSLFARYASLGRTLDADAWMFGKATTTGFFPQKFTSAGSTHPQPGEEFAAPRHSERLFITIDPDAEIRYDAGEIRGDDIVVILGTNATEDYLAELRRLGISYVVLSDPMNLQEAMTILYDRFGVRRISLQGGGIIDGAMLAERLIDRLSLVIYPGIDGAASSPSIFEYLGGASLPAAGQALELVSSETFDDGIVHLIYRFHLV